MKQEIEISSAWQQTPDEVIWASYRQGDRNAFAALYHRFFKVLLSAGLRISADRDLVKDAIQDLFVELWKTKANLVVPVSVKAYLLTSIQRKIIRHLKTARVRQIVYHEVPGADVVHSKEEQLILEQLMSEQTDHITRAMNALTKRQHEAVYLKFYANLSYADIASMMEISTEAIYNLISKSMDVLQQELSKVSEHKLC